MVPQVLFYWRREILAVFRGSILLVLSQSKYSGYLYFEYCLYSRFCTSHTASTRSIPAVSTAHTASTRIISTISTAILSLFAVRYSDYTRSMKYAGSICEKLAMFFYYSKYLATGSGTDGMDFADVGLRTLGVTMGAI